MAEEWIVMNLAVKSSGASTGGKSGRETESYQRYEAEDTQDRFDFDFDGGSDDYGF